ncbi:MAG TPA: MBL fold metallo-hydrolase [Thermomicrobiales bacterium]|nr:MBL fold metallo-hydrolase [Thermomicrobiales bacterium]
MNHISDTIATRQSEVWQTNTGIIDTGEGVILVDPGILANELDDLVASLQGRPIVAGFATHFHWDHILWTPNLGISPRYASAETCDLIMSHAERIAKNLDGFEQYVAQEYGLGPQWDRSMFFDFRPMPLGPGTIAGVDCELVPIPGHADGMVAVVLPEHDVAFVADTLSDIEIPSLADGEGQRDRYLETLDRLQGVIDRVSWVIPGHGAVADRTEAQRRLDLDRRYLTDLPRLVANAPTSQSNEDLATSILMELNETRASSDLSAQMHLDNVRMLREQTGELTPEDQ